MDHKSAPDWLIQRIPTRQVVEALSYTLSLDDVRNASRRDLIFQFGIEDPSIRDRSRLWSEISVWSLKIYATLKEAGWPVALARELFQARFQFAAAPTLREAMKSRNGMLATYEGEIIATSLAVDDFKDFNLVEDMEWVVPCLKPLLFQSNYLAVGKATRYPVLTVETDSEGMRMIVPISNIIREVRERLRSAG